MKVCTDSCLFGAYISEKPISECVHILDVGAGTGLLSLMLAQKNPQARITAIEPDNGSFLDLKENIFSSPWKEQVETVEENLKAHLKRKPEAYDMVVCNPPFFFNHLQSTDKQRNKALHLSSSDWVSWISDLKQLAKPDGEIWLLAGLDTWLRSISVFAEQEIYPFEILQLNQNRKPFRVMAGLSKAKKPMPDLESFEIRNLNNQLSEWARNLMKDYYLSQ